MRARHVAIALLCILQASTEALVQLCRVWSAVKFSDPQLMMRQAGWDPPLVHAVPAARARSLAVTSGDQVRHTE